MEDYCNYAVGKDREYSNDRLTAKSNVTQLQAQVSALTSAVAETAQTEHDKKLRLRNLNKVITTQPNQDGTSDQKRGNKDKREGELRTWLNKVFRESNFSPSYSLFIIDPKFGTKQSTTAILNASLESDKFRIEQLIASKRRSDKDLPSSQRFSGNDHKAFNIPKFQEIGNKILQFYVRELEEQVAKFQDKEKGKKIKEKWQLDIDKISLFITRKTSKNPFQIYFEFRDPSNNLTLMRFMPGNNPFQRFDFEQDIPNPGTRQKALSDAVYNKRYAAYKFQLFLINAT
jgi:hypothetical protein